MPTVDDPDLEAISNALRFLAARAGQGVVAELPCNPFAALERLRSRVMPPVPAGWLLEIQEYGVVPGFVDAPGFTAVLVHKGGDSPRIWEAEGEGPTINAAVSAAIEHIEATGFPG
ncbi:MAG TPA: hypothetical protein VE690_04075 [Rhodopila sp.]|nr:hypothetical protein [Rhodopila sp.]